MQDFQSFRSQLTPLTYIPVGDEVIAALMCVDANHELIEVLYSQHIVLIDISIHKMLCHESLLTQVKQKRVFS